MRLLHSALSCLALTASVANAAQPADLGRPHWAFIAPQRPAQPSVHHKDFVRNSIDAFILARLERDGIEPAPEADRTTLLRRLCLDLTGLPPSIPEVDAFLADTRPGAYELLVDRLLASPHFGERWGRLWLDVARYADSNGYSIDAPRSIWKYRDWVIEAINENLPFDQFVIKQLAGDLLPQDPKHPNQDALIATGFHRNTQINQEGGIDKEQFRVESVLDRVNTTGTAFLGLTVGCAQCHDHKYDPITQREYYELFAFFNSADEPTLETPTPGELAKRNAHREQVATLERALKELTATLTPQQTDWEAVLDEAALARLKPEVRTALALNPGQRSARQQKGVFEAFCESNAAWKALQARLTKLKKAAPTVTSTLVIRERTQPRESFFFVKGDFTRPGERVFPGTPKILHPLPASRAGLSGEASDIPLTRPAGTPSLSEVQRDGVRGLPGKSSAPDAQNTASTNSLPNRLDFARWLVDPRNPLTARVTVNRIWQQYFGRGIVETENDFGTQGIPPTHPELLDWLATELVAQQWNLKAIHRLIVTSSTYRQSSRIRPALTNLDPNNKLLARQSRLRLDAEVVRDVALCAAGLLSDEIGGPSVFPPQPDGVMALGQVRREWKASAGMQRYRRGLYTFFYRATPHPALAVFDAPDAFSACTRRIRSNTPLQALTLLNDAAFYGFAQALAGRVLKEAPPANAGRLDHAFRLCLARQPSTEETQRLSALLQEQSEAPSSEGKPSDAWTTLARVLLNLDETITRE